MELALGLLILLGLLTWRRYVLRRRNRPELELVKSRKAYDLMRLFREDTREHRLY